MALGTERLMSENRLKIESIWTAVAGWRVYARRSVQMTNTAPIVMVHGLGMSHRYMMPTLKRLALHAPVYALDLPGFGRSEKPPRTLDVSELAHALATWLDVNEIRGSILLGNSFGCQVIVELILRRPEIASALVLVAPTVDPQARTVSGQLIRISFDALSERLSLVPLALYEYFFVVGFNRALQTLRYALADRIEEKLPRVSLPTLIVRGGKDPLVPQAWAEEITGLLPHAHLVVIPHAAHAVNYDAPEELAREVLHFRREIGD